MVRTPLVVALAPAFALVLALGSTAPQAAAAGACAGRPSTLPAERFHDNGDGTVTDRQSMLVWMRCAAGQQWQAARCIGPADSVGFDDARRHVERVNSDGKAFHTDWRLPALRELASITDRGCIAMHGAPRTNSAVFPQTPPAAFWSATARPGEPAGERMFTMSFDSAGAAPARKSERHHLRLVRTGP